MKSYSLNFTNLAGIILTFCLFGTIGPIQGQISDTEKDAVVWETDNKELQWGPCPPFMPGTCEIAVLQGDPKNPNTDVFFKLLGNTSVQRHWHHSPERMVLVSGKMRVDYDGQAPAVIETGNYAYGPAERPHSASCISDEPCILFIAFEDPVDAMPIAESDSSGQ